MRYEPSYLKKMYFVKKNLVWLQHRTVLPIFILFFLSLLFWWINTSIIKYFTFQNIFVLCQHFHTKVRFKLGETITLWCHFYISDYHSSEERLSEGSEYQCWTPLTIQLIPLHSPSNHPLGSDARVWVWVKGQNTAVKFIFWSDGQKYTPGLLKRLSYT